LSRNKSKTSLIGKTHVLVIEPQTNTMLGGPNAPLESNLESWLLTHPTYHAVLPRIDPSAKFYGSKTSSFYGNKTKQRPPMKKHHDAPTKVSSLKVMAAIQSQDEKAAAAKRPTLTGVSSSSSSTKPTTQVSLTKATVSSSTGSGQNQEKKAKINESLSQFTKVTPPRKHDNEKSRKPSGGPASKSIVVHSSTSSKSYERSTSRKDSKDYSKESPSSSHHRRESLSSSSQGYKSSKSESKPIRDGAIKGLTDALTLKLSKNTDVKIEEDKLEDLVKTIEHDLYAFYSRDVGNKYRAKYRSLVFNIKDEKNNGLFRKIINGTIAPKKLVEMSPDDMANKELKEWRHAELKGDIEKIKSHELDLLKLGTKIVVSRKIPQRRRSQRTGKNN